MFWIQCFMGGCNVWDTMFNRMPRRIVNTVCGTAVMTCASQRYTIVQRERSILINVDTQSDGWMLDALMPRGLERKLTCN